MLKNLSLVGARYCSVRGKIAAQLQYVDKKSNKRYLLYQFKMGPKTGQVVDSNIKVKRVNIKMWSEGDLGFVLAGESD